MRACIVTGDRNASRPQWSQIVKDAIAPFDVVIHGAARGIDTIAGDVAGRETAAVIPMPAQWSLLGKAAGPIRNEAMLTVLLSLRDCGYAIEVLAFHPDIRFSSGTKHMVGIARAKGVPVTICDGDGWTCGRASGSGHGRRCDTRTEER